MSSTVIDATTPSTAAETKKKKKEQMASARKTIDSVFRIVLRGIPNDCQIQDKETGAVYTKSDIRAMMDSALQHMKNVGDSVTKSRVTNNHNRRAGFNKVDYFDSKLVSMFNEFNYGPAYRKVQDEDGKVRFEQVNADLRKCLPHLLKDHLSNRGLLTSLLSILKKQDASTNDSTDAKMFLVPQTMSKHIGHVLVDIEKEEDANRKNPSYSGKLSNVPFKRNRFSMARQQTIYAKCTLNKDTLTESERSYMEDPAVLAQIDDESKIVKDTCEFYSKK